MENTRAKLKALYQALEDRPLEPDDPNYEPGLHSLDSEDLVKHLASNVDWAERSTVNLVSGQRGSGKSTELRRLRQQLRKQGCTVFLVDMNAYLNLTLAPDITDFLLALMGALSDAYFEEFKRDKSKEDYWERFVHFANSKIKLEVGLKAGLEVKANLKGDPNFKRQLQKQLTMQLGVFVRHAQSFAEEIVASVREHKGDPSHKVVLLADSLEQIRGVGSNGEQVYQAVANLFSLQAHHLSFESFHVVYTIPPYLTPLAPGLGRHLGGGAVWNLSNVHIYQEIENLDPRKYQHIREPDSKGLAAMRSLIGKRFPNWEELFSPEQLNRLALASGGDLRDYFRLIRLALLGDSKSKDLPLSDELLTRAENHLRRDMLPIAENDRVQLEKIHRTKKASLRDKADLPRLAHYFDTNLVQSYRNGADWYDIHPLLLREIISPANAEQESLE